MKGTTEHILENDTYTSIYIHINTREVLIGFDNIVKYIVDVISNKI